MALADVLTPVIKPTKTSRPSFKALIDAYLEERETFHPFKAEIRRSTLTGFHPSGLHEACPRAVAYQYIHDVDGIKDVNEEELTPRLNLLFDFGHSIHFLIQYGYLADIPNLEYDVEVPVKGLFKEHTIGGTADIVIRLQDGKKYVGDIKTMRAEAFYRIKSAEDLSPSYLTQINLYMHGLGIPRGFFFLMNKNDSETKEVFVKQDKNILKAALDTAKEANLYLSGKDVPPILVECRKMTGQFKKCPFSSYCMTQGIEPLNIRRTKR